MANISTPSYRVLIYRRTYNLGDAIQTVALCRLLGQRTVGVFRDGPHPTGWRTLPFVVNGWLGAVGPDSADNCVFAGVHVAECDVGCIAWLGKSSGTIGARDPFTNHLLCALRMNSTLIGCATLTLQRYRGIRSGRYSVDVPARPGTTYLTNRIGRITWDKQWTLAVDRLERLRCAEIVYTNRLHIILPCLAFGTPVVFPLDSLGCVLDKHRLSLLEAIGFEFDVTVERDVSDIAERFRRFVEEQLGHSVEYREYPEMPSPICSDVFETHNGTRSVDDLRRKQRIYYVCDGAALESEYVHQAADHVKRLRAADIAAALVRTPEYVATGGSDMQGEGATIAFSDFTRSYRPDKDYLVVPGTAGERIAEYPGRKVIYVTSTLEAFAPFKDEVPNRYPFASDDVKAIFTPSHLISRHLTATFPDVRAVTLRPRIDRNMFYPQPMRQKKPQVAVPKAEIDYILPLYHMVMARLNNGLSRAAFDWVLIEGTDRDVSQILRDSVLVPFLVSGDRYSSLPAKAIACGCVLISFSGSASSEGVPEEWQCRHGDLCWAVIRVEEVMRAFYQDQDDLGAYAETVVNRQTEQPALDVVEVWRELAEAM